MENNRKFEWRILVLILGLVLSLALIVIFALRGLAYVPRQRTGEPIRPWMSVPYLAHSYHIPTHVLFQALGLPDNRHDRRPIAIIAREQHRTVQDLIQVLYQAILQAHPTDVPPTPAPLDPTRSIP
jgi:hypothetical protein